MNLETDSTEVGNKDFVAVGTTIFRGEDLAVKGAVRSSPAAWNTVMTIPQTYIFEIVAVVPDAHSPRKFKLRLQCKDDAKGPVSAICAMNGYLVSSMGQKVHKTSIHRGD